MNMFAVFYITKRTLFDILRTGVFWVAVGLAALICFSILYWGWRQIEPELDNLRIREAPMSKQLGNPDESDPDFEYQFEGEHWDPLAAMKPESMILWHSYGVTIFFANLLSIFVMMGLLGREIDKRTIDLVIARPVTRTHIFIGKLVAGWVAAIIYMVLITGWAMICQIWGGMGAQPGYIEAAIMGAISPCLIGAVTLVLSIWMRGFLAGLLSTVITFGAGTTGIFLIKILGVEVLKLDWPVKIIYRILPPLSVIGQEAVDHLETDLWFRFVYGMFQDIGPTGADGLYTEMWHVWAYLGVVLFIGWLSFFRRQFT